MFGHGQSRRWRIKHLSLTRRLIQFIRCDGPPTPRNAPADEPAPGRAVPPSARSDPCVQAVLRVASCLWAALAASASCDARRCAAACGGSGCSVNRRFKAYFRPGGGCSVRKSATSAWRGTFSARRSTTFGCRRTIWASRGASRLSRTSTSGSGSAVAMVYHTSKTISPRLRKAKPACAD